MFPPRAGRERLIDPAEVVRAALRDAAPVAGILITTEAVVVDAPKRSAGGMGDMNFSVDTLSVVAREAARRLPGLQLFR